MVKPPPAVLKKLLGQFHNLFLELLYFPAVQGLIEFEATARFNSQSPFRFAYLPNCQPRKSRDPGNAVVLNVKHEAIEIGGNQDH